MSLKSFISAAFAIGLALTAPAVAQTGTVTWGAQTSGTQRNLSVNQSGTNYSIGKLDTSTGKYLPPFFVPPGTGGVQQSFQTRAEKSVLVTDFGASGSGQTTTGTVSSGSASLLVAALRDFAVGHSVRVKGAGPAFTIPQATGVTVTQNGTTGATRYDYKISMMACDGGLGVPVIGTATNGNAALSSTNYIRITLTPGAGYCGYAVWRSVNSGAYVYAGAGTQTQWDDTGWAPNWRPDNIDAAPPAAARGRDLVAKITAISGTTLTLSASAGSSVSGAAVFHDDTQAFKDAVTFAGTLANGANIIVPCGQYNLSSSITVATANTGFTGAGPCSKLNTYGGDNDFVYVGTSYSAFRFGGWITDFYHPAYNKYNGWTHKVSFWQNMDISRVFVDHPWAGQYFHDVNDVRMFHDRFVYVWGYGQTSLRIDSGTAAAEYSCCFDIRDWYVNNLSTNSGMNGGRNGSNGVAIDGNVATVIAYNMAVSNIEGNGMSIGNYVGHPTGFPSFLHFKDFGSEFSNGRAVSIDAGQDIFFTDSILHGARNNNHNFYAANGTKAISWTGGRNGNAGCSNFYISGQDVKILGSAIINASAPNSGGTSGVCNGVLLDSTAYNVTVSGNFIGKEYGVGWSQNRPVYVANGATRFAVTGNVFDGNLTNAVDNQAGQSKTQVSEPNSGADEPTISSGFGTGAVIGQSGGHRTFRLNVGTGGTASTGVVGLPKAVATWNCAVTNMTTGSMTTKQTSGTQTTVTVTNYNAAGTQTAWTASDVLMLKCDPL